MKNLNAPSEPHDPDPVRFDIVDGRSVFYFYSETWTELHGPYDNEDIARIELKKYCDTFLTPNP